MRVVTENKNHNLQYFVFVFTLIVWCQDQICPLWWVLEEEVIHYLVLYLLDDDERWKLGVCVCFLDVRKIGKWLMELSRSVITFDPFIFLQTIGIPLFMCVLGESGWILFHSFSFHVKIISSTLVTMVRPRNDLRMKEFLACCFHYLIRFPSSPSPSGWQELTSRWYLFKIRNIGSFVNDI